MNSLKLNKKIYSKPELEVVEVDHEISLVMMTKPGNMNPPPSSPSAMQNSSPLEGTSAPGDSYQPTSEQDVFGGSSVNY